MIPNNLDYIFDFIEGMKSFIDFGEYLLLYMSDGNPHKIPSVHFWANTFLILDRFKDLKITFRDGTIITKEICFKEMESCYIKEKKIEYCNQFFDKLIR